MLYNNEICFAWDDFKASQNLKKHGVSFFEATNIWKDPHSLEMPDPEHSSVEDRWVRLGYSTGSRILVVVFCEHRDEVIRIISSRKATTHEKRQYDERRI